MGIKRLFLPNHEYPTYFSHSFFFFFPQMTWHSHPALAKHWKQMYFSLEHAPLQKAGDGHLSVFHRGVWYWQPFLCHHTLPCAPQGWGPAHLRCFKAGEDEERLHVEEEVEGLRDRSKWRVFCHQEQRSVQLPPLTPPSALTQNSPSQESERAFYKYNYQTVGINTTRQMDSSAQTDRLDGEIK